MAYSTCPQCGQKSEQTDWYQGLVYVRTIWWCADCELLWLRFCHHFYEVIIKGIVLKSNHGPDVETGVSRLEHIRGWNYQTDGGA